jgi:mono/diheme cytochrome c family protein
MLSPPSSLRPLCLCGVLFLCATQELLAQPPFSLLAKHCVTCHNTSDPKAGLDLSQAVTALKGGDSGAVIVPNKPADSLLVERVTDGSMPPEHDGRRLTPAEVAILKDWIAAGAKWPEGKKLSQFEFTTDRRAGLDWWSLQPIQNPSPPAASQSQQPVDAFLTAKLAPAGLKFSAPADRRTLIRRAYLDLIGLPPTPAEVASFANDTAPDAYERVLDQLLASPHYGERWGRHWLDVARYGESDGFEHDKYREHAWPYRDYVIRSLNADKPYADFIIEQLAGDALPNATREQIAATGFLVAGPWDEIQNVGASPTEKRRAREEQQEELIAAVSQSFLGLTVNCARCHDHKFDPVPQTDYYQLKAALDGVDHGLRPWQTAAEQHAWEAEQKPLQGELARVKSRLADLSQQLPGDARLEKGADQKLVPGKFGQTFSPHHHAVAAPPSAAYDLPPLTIECWARLAGQKNFNVLLACGPKSNSDHWELYTYAGSGELSLYLPGCQPAEIKSGVDVCDGEWHYLAATLTESEVQLFVDGRLVRTTAIKRTAKADKDGPLQFAALVDKSIGCEGLIDEVRLSRGVRKIDSVPAEPFAVDADTLALWHFDELLAGSFRDHARTADATDAEAARTEIAKLSDEQKQLEAKLKERPRPQVYVGVRKQPEPTLLLVRGDLTKPGPPVLPGMLTAVRTIASEQIPADSPEAMRRLKLAQWIAHPHNPLPWRVMANRVWQHHFGRGLVDTTSDFGFSGGRPSHPELLDHLAQELRRDGSLKSLHRQIMNSQAYRQTSVPNETTLISAQEVDADNRLLWRFPTRRLEAEIVRDAMLAVSGQLNRTQGGPSFKPFTVTVFNTHFYHLHDQDKPELARRTVYRAAVVTGRNPLLTALDCPTPSLAAPQRQETVTPLQTLSLMNDSFVLRQATRLAQRVQNTESPAEQVRELYSLALSRDPSAAELAAGQSLLAEQSARELAWALLNSSEFLFQR